VWDGGALAADIDSERGVRCFVHEPGTLVPLFQQERGEVFTYVNDHLGMPKELIDLAGRVAWAAAHSAWGRVVETHADRSSELSRGRKVESPFRLLGQVADEETGLCWTRFRCFDPEVGRWCSPDPLGWVGGSNLFGFDGVPTADVDPLGLNSGPGSGAHTSGATAPLRAGATPNSIYTYTTPDGRLALQNAIYDQNGNVVAHVDFQNHGKDKKTGAEAKSGHGHIFPQPGNPGSGHGPGKPHIENNQLPPAWSALPPGIQPETPVGT
jgi:RHS repeat-associated protein